MMDMTISLEYVPDELLAGLLNTLSHYAGQVSEHSAGLSYLLRNISAGCAIELTKRYKFQGFLEEHPELKENMLD